MRYHRLSLLVLMLLHLSPPLLAAEKCTLEQWRSPQQPLGLWINQDNWLAPENLRFGQQSPTGFMPLLKIQSPASKKILRLAPLQLDIGRITATDPLDLQQRDIGFLLDTRLYADGLVVLLNGKVMREQYWHGLTAPQPRLLLGASRPVLSLIGAIAVAEGKLAPDKSIVRYIPALNTQTGLRRLSVQRLLEANSRFEWSPAEINDWQVAGGWKSGKNRGNVREWLNQPDRWERNLADKPLKVGDNGPDGDLLAWALNESYRAPLSQIFCDSVLSKLHPENPVFWLTDHQGTELSNGLALSLRDFSRFGHMLIEARSSASRSKIPKWLIETLTASEGGRKGNIPELSGLTKGSEYRYGFVHLGGAPNRIAILGSYGNSLYVDFDRRLVIAIFASYPKDYSGGALATLEKVWETLSSATQLTGKR